MKYAAGTLFGSFLALYLLFCPPSADASDIKPHQKTDLQDVYLVLNHHATGRVMIMGYYLEGEILLPLSELFTILMISHEPDFSNALFKGEHLKDGSGFLIDFENYVARSTETEIELKESDFHIGDLDFYLRSDLFIDLFDLDFQVDLRNLTIRVFTPHTLPVVEREERRRRSQHQLSNRRLPIDADIIHGRERTLLGGAMVDYNVSSSMDSENSNIYNYNLRGGAELLGGDIQGAITGAFSGDFHTNRANSVRWRYAMPDNLWLTSASAGQLFTAEGLQSRNFTGIQLTNQPVAPRVLFDDYMIVGSTEPDAEVEIYLDRRLVDVQIADGLGNYTLSVPITYGTTNVEIITYLPDGRIEEERRRIQIPFTFIPTGEFNYNVSGGVLEKPLPGRINRSYISEASAAYGITNHLTAKTGIQYIDDDLIDRPLIYGSISARIWREHLFSFDVAPDYYYRMNASAFYPSNISWRVNYTAFTGPGLYNRSGDDHLIHANLYLPFRFQYATIGFRLNADHRRQNTFNQTRYNSDISLHTGRLTLRFGQRDVFTGLPDQFQTPNSRLTASALYTISRSAGMRLFKGMTLRSQIQYSRHSDQIDRLDFQVSRSVLRQGRFWIRTTHSPVRKNTIADAGITFNFNSFRSTSTVQAGASHLNYRQSFSGSANFDSHHNDFYFSNRNQVGRSAASVRMFVDVNDSGTYDKEEGDYLIKDSAVRLHRGGVTRRADDGITRFMQLQAYQVYNLEINKSALRNPMLVPVYNTFAILTDPNQSKMVDIPFYMAGVVEGRVERERNGRLEPVGGIRVILKQVDGDFEATLRTFSDGGFYQMEIPPGKYVVTVDSDQLRYLELHSTPEAIEIEIERSPMGDFVEDLNFRLHRQ